MSTHREHGSVILLVALLMPILLLMTAGGVAGFGLYASHRELQRAADQGALAAAAALPPLDPNILVEDAPHPLPGTEEVWGVVDETGIVPPVEPPRMRDLVPDPRSVACTIGSAALGAGSAAVVGAFEGELGDDLSGDEPDSDPVCEDIRVEPVIGPDPAGTTPVDCTSELIRRMAADAGDLDFEGLAPLGGLQAIVDAIVSMPLNHALPAAFTPRVRVTVHAHIRPPLLSLVTGSASGTMTASAVAMRRIKNAVVVPILPEQKLLIDLGLATVEETITDPVNLNRALATPQADLLAALDDTDERLTEVTDGYGLPCRHMLHNLRRDLRDIYDPPTGPAPSATDIVDAAILAAERTAARTSIPEPDPSDPDSLAGEAFLLIGVAVDEAMQPLAATQIPILDMALTVMRRVSDGSVECSEQDLLDAGNSVETCYTASVVSALNAYGAFRASLVE